MTYQEQLKEKVLNKEVLSMEEKDYLHMRMLQHNAEVDDYIGTTLASHLVEGKSFGKCAEAMEMSTEAWLILYNTYMEDIVRCIAEVSRVEEVLEIEDTTPGFYISHRFNPITMIRGKSVNLFVQSIERDKFEKLIKEHDYISRIKQREIIELYNSMFCLRLERFWDNIEYKPGDTILVLDERKDIDYNGPLNRTPLNYFYVEIDPMDPEEMI